MKKLLLSLVAVVCFSLSSKAQGDVKFGAGIMLWDISEAIGLQGKALYGLNENLELSGAFTYILKDFIDFQIDANVQYRGLDVAESFKLQPLAGLTYIKFSGFSDTALHIGASFRLTLESGMDLYVEPTIVLNNGSGINIAGGILF